MGWGGKSFRIKLGATVGTQRVTKNPTKFDTQYAEAKLGKGVDSVAIPLFDFDYDSEGFDSRRVVVFRTTARQGRIAPSVQRRHSKAGLVIVCLGVEDWLFLAQNIPKGSVSPMQTPVKAGLLYD